MARRSAHSMASRFAGCRPFAHSTLWPRRVGDAQEREAAGAVFGDVEVPGWNVFGHAHCGNATHPLAGQILTMHGGPAAALKAKRRNGAATPSAASSPASAKTPAASSSCGKLPCTY